MKTEYTVKVKKGAGHQRAINDIITSRPTPIREVAQGANTDLSAWELFLDEAMQEIVLDYTNSRIQSVRNSMDNEQLINGKNCHPKITTLKEMRAFYRICYARVVLNMNLRYFTDKFKTSHMVTPFSMHQCLITTESVEYATDNF